MTTTPNPTRRTRQVPQEDEDAILDAVGKWLERDVRPHVHLLPFQGGLRAEFFVRPFGDDGPFCRPGQGGANVFASLGG